MVHAEIGVIGGTGFYSLLDETDELDVETPFGEPSDKVAIGSVGGRQVAFLPRHGRHHQFPAHAVNYRANVWALRSLGVRRVLAPAAVGSLRADLGPGRVVVPDQLVDRTAGRRQTFYDSGVAHVSFADPYCPAGRTAVLKTGAEAGADLVDGATMVVVEGPRFSTRAESAWFAAMGWSLVNMTGHPEAVLARELALCYTAIALVTDYDAGVDAGSAVSQDTVLEVFGRNVARLRELICRVVTELPARGGCDCAGAVDGMTLPFELP